MKLNIQDRLLIMNAFLPKESDLLTMRVVKGINEKLEASEKELVAIEFDPQINRHNFKLAEELIVNIDFTESEISVIKKQIELNDNNKKITIHYLGIIDKINAWKKEEKVEETVSK